MATDYTVITHKIEVHLHKHGDGEEAIQRYKEEFRIWDEINDNLYKAANRIVSHCFFNDAYEYRLKIHSPRFQEIEKLLRYSKRNKLTNEDIKQLKDERKQLFADFKKQRFAFLRGGATEGSNPEQNSTYKVVRNEFIDIIPSDILTCLNQNITKVYKAYSKEVEFGMRTIPNYKRGIPVPFTIKPNGVLNLQKREDGSIFIHFPKGLEWDLDRSNNREIVERVLSGQYDVGNSSIQESKNKKRFLLLVVKIPKESNKLDPNRIVGVDAGINIPLYAVLNDSEKTKIKIGSRETFLNVRKRMDAQRRSLIKDLRHSTMGGHGRTQKLQAQDYFKSKERNWVHTQNHIYSKSVIEFAIKHKAGVIHLERLTGFGKDEKNNSIGTQYKFLRRFWSYYELQSMIEYKANAAGIEVRYIDPYHTSQTCSFCGHYEPNQRLDQPTFMCKNPECTKGKGKKLPDGSYTGINADWNAARNIALSDNIVDRKKK